MTNWSPELIEFLSSYNLLSQTAFARILWAAITPKWIDFTKQDSHLFEKEIFGQYLKHGHNTMVFIPLISNASFNGYIAFSGSRREFPEIVEMMELTYICQHMHAQVDRILPNLTRKKLDLGERQIEIIKLISRGATISEAADNLGLSSTTINFHLQKAMTILGCRSRCQLVAEMLRLKLIS